MASPLVVPQAQMANPALKPVPVAGHSLNLPPGFTVSVLASGLSAPRFMALDSNGDLAVAEDGAGRVILFPKQANGQLSGSPMILASGLNDPSSVAFYKDWLYVAEQRQIDRYDYKSGVASNRQVVIPNLPVGTDHHTRTIVFGSDGSLYLAMGSPCNVCVSNPPYATIGRYNADGSGYQLVAKGLRNAVGLAFQPGTGQLWATVNGRDGLGDNIPWDLLTAIRDGADYGFPRCYDDRQPDPEFGGQGCAGMALPDVGLQAHVAPLGLAFYTGSQFPAEYKGDIFVALHGSWNRSMTVGYSLVRAHFDNGRIASVTDFATGWRPSSSGQVITTPFGLGTSGAWGRPVQPVVGADGSLYVSDDLLGAVYKISYTGAAATG